MPRLNEEQKERLRTKTVEVLLELRRSYLSTGASALKHWEQLRNRTLSAARRSVNPDEWATTMMRGLQLPAPSKSASRALVDLGATVRELGCSREWLDMCERELGLLIAMTRLAAERRKDAIDETQEV